MNRRLPICAVVILLFCGLISSQGQEKEKPKYTTVTFRQAVAGKTPDEVQKLLGEPFKKGKLATKDIWSMTYNMDIRSTSKTQYERSVVILFDSGDDTAKTLLFSKTLAR